MVQCEEEMIVHVSDFYPVMCYDVLKSSSDVWIGMQDISGGQPVQLEGTDLPVWGMEIDPDKAKQQFRNYSASDKGNKVNICHVSLA